MGCNCGGQTPADKQAAEVADARRAAVADKPRQIPERLRKYYEVPAPAEDANKEH